MQFLRLVGVWCVIVLLSVWDVHTQEPTSDPSLAAVAAQVKALELKLQAAENKVAAAEKKLATAENRLSQVPAPSAADQAKQLKQAWTVLCQANGAKRVKELVIDRSANKITATCAF